MTLEELERITRRFYALNQCETDIVLPNVQVIERKNVSEIEAVVYNPVICLILQGRKITSIGNQSITLSRGDALLVSHDLPVTSRITEASTKTPYFALVLTLDIGIIRGLYEQVGASIPEQTNATSLSSSIVQSNCMEPIARYLNLMGKSLETQVLGPQIMREIHFQLLMSDIGGMLRNLLTVNSHASQIATAITHIRKHFCNPLIVVELARQTGMSQSSFHTHFKSITGTTPLQYQKDLRMIEAQKLLAVGKQSVSSVSSQVGYESPTHFSRDYSRKFGCSPKHHQGLSA